MYKMMDFVTFVSVLKGLVDDLLVLVKEEIEKFICEHEDIKDISASSKALSSSRLSQSSTPINDDMRQLSVLNNIQIMVGELRKNLVQYYIASSDMNKDSHILDTYKQLTQELMKLGLCKVYIQTKLESIKKEDHELRFRESIMLIKNFIYGRLERGKQLTSSEGRHESARIHYEHKEPAGRSLFKPPKKKMTDGHLTQAKNMQNYEKKLKTFYLEQYNTIINNEKLLETKLVELERKRNSLIKRRKEERELMGTNMVLGTKLLEIREENLHLLYEYMCQRNEVTTVINRLKRNKLDPHYRQKGYQSLEPQNGDDTRNKLDSSSTQVGYQSLELQKDSAESIGVALSETGSFEREDGGSINWSEGYEESMDIEQINDYFKMEHDLTIVEYEMDDRDDISSQVYEADSEANPQDESKYSEHYVDGSDGFENDESLKSELSTLNRLPEMKAKLTWFTAHRTENTAPVEQQLWETRQRLAERLMRLNRLRRRRLILREMRGKKLAFYRVRRRMVQFMGNEYKAQLVSLKTVLHGIQRQDGIHAAWSEKYDQFENDMRVLKCDRSALTKERGKNRNARKKFSELRIKCNENWKNIESKAFKQTEANKSILAHWTRLVLDDRNAKKKVFARKVTIIQDKNTKLDKLINSEWKRVNSGIKCLKNEMKKRKDDLEEITEDIEKWNGKIQDLNHLKQLEHKKIKEAKEDCFRMGYMFR